MVRNSVWKRGSNSVNFSTNLLAFSEFYQNSMSRKYKFHNPDGLYFVTFAIVEWIDLFTRNEYKDILALAVTCLIMAQTTLLATPPC